MYGFSAWTDEGRSLVLNQGAFFYGPNLLDSSLVALFARLPTHKVPTKEQMHASLSREVDAPR